VEKTHNLSILPTLTRCHFAITSFDIWMFKGTYGVFALVIIFWVVIGSQSM
jgi:hypothetical protein